MAKKAFDDANVKYENKINKLDQKFFDINEKVSKLTKEKLKKVEKENEKLKRQLQNKECKSKIRCR